MPVTTRPVPGRAAQDRRLIIVLNDQPAQRHPRRSSWAGSGPNQVADPATDLGVPFRMQLGNRSITDQPGSG